MNDKLLKATLELVEASFERDFLVSDGDDGTEARVFDAVEAVLDILAENRAPWVRSWVRGLWAKREAETAAAQAV